MKWFKDIASALVSKITATQAFVCLLLMILGTTGYYMFDRYYDYKEAIDLNQPKRDIRKVNELKEQGVLYSDITNSYPDRTKGTVGRAQIGE